MFQRNRTTEEEMAGYPGKRTPSNNIQTRRDRSQNRGGAQHRARRRVRAKNPSPALPVE